jgi:hypothetical protein
VAEVVASDVQFLGRRRAGTNDTTNLMSADASPDAARA